MTIPMLDHGIVPSIMIASVVALLMDNSQYDAPTGDNQNNSGLSEMSGQMMLPK